MTQRIASVSLDLDNKWSYLRTRGDEAWADYPSYLDIVVPRIMDFVGRYEIRLTVFVVGQDAERAENRGPISTISARGHSIGNHSFRHEPWLHLYSRAELIQEMENAERAIEGATGQRTTAFRGPGFSVSRTVLEVLSDRGYAYDASIFPNVLNPLSRAYLLTQSSLSKSEKEQRKNLFGSASDALRPVKPFIWTIGDHRLLEIPVTTMPWFKLPIHLTYLLFLSTYSARAAMAYFRFGLSMCRMTGTEPSILLHPTDFLGREDGVGLDFFPGMQLETDAKLDVVRRVFELLGEHHEIVSLSEHAEAISHRDLSELGPAGI